ncbi:sulfotransferase [Sinorhizobium meliloti]|uniref:sulfotransferase n=1 Tax=Rhizobium meliloti TaxID=382 RepID=UPI00207302D0|nr:sulfotransferase [Sinorhizobium meliloti]MCM5693043.1 sulfotransferase [Sinorhizobium meliloti]
MTNSAVSPIILFGFQRSGTTALAHYLSECFARNDGVFTVNGKLLYYLNRWLTDEDLRYRHFRSDEIAHSIGRIQPGGPAAEVWIEAARSALDEVAGLIAEGTELSRVDMTALILDRVYSNWKRWGEKYNELVLSISYLESVLHQPRYVFLYRNPSSVTRSMLQWSGHRPWNPREMQSAEAKWHAWNQAAYHELLRVDRVRVLYINYDELCDDSGIADELEYFIELDCADFIRSRYSRKSDRAPLSFLSGEAEQLWSSLVYSR